MSKIFDLVILSLGLIGVGGCTQLGSKPGIERADDLGLQLGPNELQPLPPLPPLPDLSASQAKDRFYRDGFVEQWMAHSDHLCREYKDKIILVSRNTRFATDATSTILSGLATIFTAVGTIHPLTGAATIVSGVGAAAQTDTFEQQSGEIIASAIQTARENQANQIEDNLKKLDWNQYSIYRAQRDVIDYHNMCSLETALAQVRSSLNATSPNAGQTAPAAQGVEPVKPIVIVNPPVGGGSEGRQNPPAGGGGGGTGGGTRGSLPSGGGRGRAVPDCASLRDADDVRLCTTVPDFRRIQKALCLPTAQQSGIWGFQSGSALRKFKGTAPGNDVLTVADRRALLSQTDADIEARCGAPQRLDTLEKAAFQLRGKPVTLPQGKVTVRAAQPNGQDGTVEISLCATVLPDPSVDIPAIAKAAFDQHLTQNGMPRFPEIDVGRLKILDQNHAPVASVGAIPLCR